MFDHWLESSHRLFDHWLETSHRGDSKQWSNIGFGEEITQVVAIEVNFAHLVLSSDNE